MDPLRDGPDAFREPGDCPPGRNDREGSGDRYRWLVENSVDVIAELDVNGIIRFASPAVERVLGYRPEEVLGTSCFSLVHPDDLPKTREAFAYLLQHPGISGPQLEIRGRHNDGSWRYVEALGKNVVSESTQSAIVLCVRDVTTHKQAEAALADRTRQLETVRIVSEEIARELDLTALLGLITRRAKDLIGASMGMTRLWDEAREELVPFAWDGVGEWLVHKALRLGEGVAGTAAQRREGLIVNEFRHSSYATPLHLERTTYTAVLAEPLLYREQLVGVLALGREDSVAFTLDQQEVLRLFATQAAIAIENAQLHAAAVRRSQELEAVRTISAEIIRELDLPGVLNLIVRHAVALGSAMSGSIRLWNPERQMLVPEAATGSLRHAAGLSLGLGEGVVGTAAAQRRGLIVNDFRTSAYAIPPLLEGTTHTAVMATPLLYGERLVGVLGITRDQTEPAFTERDLEVLNLFAPQAAIAVENARLYDTALRRGEELQALLDASHSLMADLDLHGMLERIVAAASTISGSTRIKIALYDPAARALRVECDTGSATPVGTLIPLEGTLSGLAFRTREPVFSADGVHDPRNAFAAADAALGLVTSLNLPICGRETVLGTLSFHTMAPRSYTPEEFGYLQAFAGQAAIAIENAQLHERLALRLQSQEALTRLSQVISASLDLDVVLPEIAGAAQALMGGALATFWTVDEVQRTLRIRAFSDATMVDYPRALLRFGEGGAGWVAEHRQVLNVADRAVNPRFFAQAWANQHGIASFLGVPVVLGETLLAVLVLNGHQPFQLTPETQSLLDSFVAQAAIAVKNARLFAELNESYAQLQQAQEELVRSEKLRGLGQMAAGIAHDLNNMLAAILGQVELLKLRGAPTGVRDGLATIEMAASDGAAVVRRLQDFARQRAASALAPMDLAQAVEEALELTRPRWQDEPQQRGKTIAVHAALGDLPPILGHAPEIREVLINLIFNAVDAMPDGGRLTLAGAATSAGITLTLTDTGIGMAEDVRQKIFEPFFTTKGVRGTGLGLSVAYGIMERHGGRMDVTSAPGQGTTVTLHFQAAAAGIAAPAAAHPLRSASRRLLLIDDEMTVRTTMGTLLRAVGHEVTEAENGPEGLASLADRPVDLVITDLGMPGMTGWEVAQQVKAAHPRLPVILLTGWGQQAPPPASGQECIDRVLGKPIRLEALQGAIAALTGPGDSPHREDPATDRRSRPDPRRILTSRADER